MSFKVPVVKLRVDIEALVEWRQLLETAMSKTDKRITAHFVNLTFVKQLYPASLDSVNTMLPDIEPLLISYLADALKLKEEQQ